MIRVVGSVDDGVSVAVAEFPFCTMAKPTLIPAFWVLVPANVGAAAGRVGDEVVGDAVGVEVGADVVGDSVTMGSLSAHTPHSEHAMYAKTSASLMNWTSAPQKSTLL